MVRAETQAQRLVVPVGIVIAAVVVSVSVIYGIDARMDHKIQEKLTPFEHRLGKIEGKQDRILEEVQEIRESVARMEGRTGQ